MSPLKEYVKSDKEIKIVSKFRKEYVKKYSNFLINKGRITKKSIVVEVPCGTGDMAKSIYEKIKPNKFILIDINPNMIVSARKKLSSNNVFILGDAGHIGNLVKEKVDTIICLNGFHQYIERKENFLKGCYKILKENGILVFDISTRGLNDRYTKDFLNNYQKELKKYVKKYNIKPSLPKWPDEKLIRKYEKMILKSGLKLLDKVRFKRWITVKHFLKGALIIPGRSRPWLEGLDYNKRKESLSYSVKTVVKKIGEKKLEENRVFLITKK